MTALQADIGRAAREQSAARELAFCMLGIVLAVKQVDMLMVRLGVGRVSA